VGNYLTGFAVTDGFNTALTPYSFNLTKSRELLEAAGFFPVAPPSIWVTWGFALTVMLAAPALTLPSIHITELRRNRSVGRYEAPSSPTT